MKESSQNPTAWLLTCVLLSALAAWQSNSSHAQDHAGLRPGDRVEVDGVGVIVPEPGTEVWAAALRPDSGTSVLGVETRADGSVVVHRGPVVTVEAGEPVGPAQGACSDGAYSLHADTWKKSYRWQFNKDSAPSEVDADRATSAVRDGVGNIPQANNDCGLADRVGATQKYQGTTGQDGNIGSDSTCKSSNGKNVVGFGNLLAAHLAFSCWWIMNGNVVEGDIRLNKTEYDWVVKIGGGCATKFSVEGVVTHEAGHVFGLGHVSEALHGSLTMSSVMLACQSSEKTLGLGDVRGLEAQY